MSTKLDFEGRQRVSVLIEQIGDDLDEYAWRIVEQEVEIERLAIENKALRAENTRLRELVELEPDLDDALAGKDASHE